MKQLNLFTENGVQMPFSFIVSDAVMPSGFTDKRQAVHKHDDGKYYRHVPATIWKDGKKKQITNYIEVKDYNQINLL